MLAAPIITVACSLAEHDDPPPGQVTSIPGSTTGPDWELEPEVLIDTLDTVGGVGIGEGATSVSAIDAPQVDAAGVLSESPL